jgi:hypothetical protein
VEFDKTLTGDRSAALCLVDSVGNHNVEILTQAIQLPSTLPVGVFETEAGTLELARRVFGNDLATIDAP